MAPHEMKQLATKVCDLYLCKDYEERLQEVDLGEHMRLSIARTLEENEQKVLKLAAEHPELSDLILMACGYPRLSETYKEMLTHYLVQED